MKKLIHRLHYWLSSAVLLLACQSLGAAELPSLTEQLHDPAVIAQGEYLARAGNCAFCHSAADGEPYAGGRALLTPFGKIYTSNLTSDALTGLGEWDFNLFWQAMQQGKGRHGEYLYPAFPYVSFTQVNKEDALALFAYLRTLPAVQQANIEPELGFPYNIRSLLMAWRTLYFSAGEYQPDPSQSDSWNRGAYLVQGLGHCNECHTQRNLLGAMDTKQPLGGGVMPVQGWYAPNLSMQPGGGLEGWTAEDVVQLLQTGLSAKGSALGPMAEVVRNSTQYLTNTDLAAIADYLSSLPAPKQPDVAVAAATDLAAGQTLYQQQCESCHGQQGQGVNNVYPALAGNTTVLEPSAVNSIRSVLHGGFAPLTQHNPEPYSMPPFSGQLNNAEIAAVVNYIRQSWGNQAPPINAATVTQVRALPLRY